MRTVAAALALVLGASTAHAVPAFLKLHQKKYGFGKMSCALCHTGGAGGKLNDYGKAFFKSGGDWKAFEAVEGDDSDGDGVRNLEEMKAGSNPGDPASTPRRPGTWLTIVKPEDTMPLDDLAELFPKAKRFEYQDVELTDTEAEEIGKAIGDRLGPEARLTTLYFPIDDSKTPPMRAGVAAFCADALPEGLLTTAVSLGPDGRIVRAWGALYTPIGRDSLKELSRQLAGRPIDAPLVLGQDVKPIRGNRRLSEAGVRTFRKDLLLIAKSLGTK